MNNKRQLLTLGIIAAVILVAGAVIVFSDRKEPITGSAPESLVRDESHMTGSKNAKVTVVEFGDYQCPACASAHPVVKEMRSAYRDNPDFNFVFRNFPLSQHKNARIASEAAESAGAQNMFWEMHDKLYEMQDKWSDSTDPMSFFVKYAGELGLDVEKFKTDVTTHAYASSIAEDERDAESVGLEATPTFFINGRKETGVPNLEAFKKIIETGLHR